MAGQTSQPGALRALEALQAFAELEMRVARFYERLAEMFDDEPEVSEFWLRLSAEEIGHADALRSTVEVLPEVWPSYRAERPLIERAVIDTLSREIDACEVLMNRHERSLDTAFRCALFLESSELNDIYQWVMDSLPTVWIHGWGSESENPGGHILSLCQIIERRAQDPQLHAQARTLRRQWEEYLTG